MKTLTERRDILIKQGILLYGASDTGKTLLGLTVAKLPHIERVWWLDLEKGLGAAWAKNIPNHLKLTRSEADKIIPVSIEDTDTDPRAAKTVYQMLTTISPIFVNFEGGQLSLKAKDGYERWEPLASLPKSHALVIDSGSQLSSSIEKHFSNQGMDGLDLWRNSQSRLHGILSAIQAAPIPIIMITHIVLDEPEVVASKRQGGSKPNSRLILTGRKAQIFPLLGSKNSSFNAKRYFGHSLYCMFDGSKYLVVSTPGALDYTTPGNRAGVELEALETPTLLDLFPKNLSDFSGRADSPQLASVASKGASND